MGHKAYFKGKEGTTKYERYIDVPSEVPVNTRWALYQLSYFSDDD